MRSKFDNSLRLLATVMQYPPNCPVTAKQLSEVLTLSVSYVEALVRDLRSNELITSVRGPGGGYIAGPKLENATAGDVFNICNEDHSEEVESIQNPLHAVVADIGIQLRNLEKTFLNNYRLSNFYDQKFEFSFNNASKSNGLKPVPWLQPFRPEAPNSIFDLARFQSAQSVGVRA